MSTSAFEKCAMCGGVLGVFRVLVGGEAFHPRCSHDGRDHRIAELEAAMRRLWDIGKTVTVDGQRGCFVPEAEWRRLVVDPAHR